MSLLKRRMTVGSLLSSDIFGSRLFLSFLSCLNVFVILSAHGKGSLWLLSSVFKSQTSCTSCFCVTHLWCACFKLLNVPMIQLINSCHVPCNKADCTALECGSDSLTTRVNCWQAWFYVNVHKSLKRPETVPQPCCLLCLDVLYSVSYAL